MKKFLSLVKAVFSEDMNPLKYSVKPGSSKVLKLALPVGLSLLIMYAVGSYAGAMLIPMKMMGMPQMVPVLFIVITSFLSLLEAIYKAPSVLFEARDNDLLFSLPLKKSTVMYVRILKLIVFQVIYNSLFLLPVFVVYAAIVRPGVGYYVASLLYLILVPILPTVVGSLLGYIVKMITAGFKKKRLVQTLATFAVIAGVTVIGMNYQGIMSAVTENGEGIMQTMGQIYYPVEAYIELIDELDVLTLVKAVAFAVVPLVIFVGLGSLGYQKIISKSQEVGRARRKNMTEEKLNQQIKARNVTWALVKKELARFTSSPVYMVNSMFGVFIMVFAAVILAINGPAVAEMVDLSMVGITPEMILSWLPKLFCILVVFVGMTTSITSSSVSLEGKSFDITKGLPVPAKKILLGKVLMSNLVVMPLMLVSDVVFGVRFGLGAGDMALILAYTLVAPTLAALIGLLANLKYPKLEFTSDTDVVKQSASVMVATMIGFIVSVVAIVLAFLFMLVLTWYVVGLLVLLIALTIGAWCLLTTWGVKRWNEID